MTKAYVLANVKVNDTEGYRVAYQQHVATLVEKYKGKFLVRGGDKSDLEGKISARYTQEIKSLQTSLIQARDKCERLVIEKEDISQAITAKFQKEISNLKVNITQTRESLDQAKIEKSEAIQLAVSTFITENEGLKKTITGLREKLEQAQIKIKDEGARRGWLKQFKRLK